LILVALVIVKEGMLISEIDHVATFRKYQLTKFNVYLTLLYFRRKKTC